MIFQQSSMLFASLALIAPAIQTCDALKLDLDLDTDVDVDVEAEDDSDVDVDIDIEVSVEIDVEEGDGADGGNEQPPSPPEYNLCVNEGGTMGCYDSVQDAVYAADPGNVIKVFPGEYEEDVLIDTSVSLVGAQAGTCGFKRYFGDSDESTIIGTITIQAPDVSIDGFSLTAPPEDLGPAFGVIVKQSGNDAKIANNIIQGITSTGTTLDNTAQAIYLENGPDDVDILCNHIYGVTSYASAKGVFIGDSTATNASTGILIRDNKINAIESTSRGGYAILVNNGTSTTVKIFDNKIFDIRGLGWAHAIGLEEDTPNSLVKGNWISSVEQTGPIVPPLTVKNEVAVFFELNPSFATVHVNYNKFEDVAFGIAEFQTPPPPGAIDGECNWWDSPAGPNSVPGSDVSVGGEVDFTPWLIAPNGPCTGTPAP